ncbi:MAG: M20 family metallopeptidase [Sulfolobus sp.]
MIKLLSELVSFKTVNPPGKDYDKIAYYLRDILEEISFTVELIEIPENYLDKNYIYSPQHKGNKRIIVLARNDKEPIVHFNAHYDVVPPGSGWVSDPFSLKVVDDIAYGRGVSDMKGGIVSMYLTLSKTKVPVEISIVPDEESGGIGTKYLMELNKTKPKYVIIGEPSFPDIYVGHYGIIRGLIKVKGKQAHASIVNEGDNAFIKASKLAVEIHNLSDKIVLGGYVMNSSDNDGIIPGEFSFSFYRAITPYEEAENVRNEILNIINEASKRVNVRDYEVIFKSITPGSITPQDSKLVKIAEECSIKHGIMPNKKISLLRYDAVFFKPYADVINIGPGNQAHVPNESISISNIIKVSEIYDCVLSRLISVYP